MNLDDGYVPLELFGKDHWSTLAYAETVMVDCGGFQIGLDPRMRQCRRHYRVMHDFCKNPKRLSSAPNHGCMWNDNYSTTLNDGSKVIGHDDWHCIQDLAEAGMFSVEGKVIAAADCEPGETLLLSELGREYVGRLRDHKSQGGTFSNFRPALKSATSDTASVEMNP